MAKSAAQYYEVRWRLKDSDEAWSPPQRVNPASEVVVEGLDRSKTYEFEARAVSNCGAKSDWVSGDHTVPDAPTGTLTLAGIKGEVDDAAADAAAANAELADIASDNVLTAGEKPIVIRDYNVIITEQAGIDAQAVSFGITTERTAYDTSVTALTSYLATLTTATNWNDLSGNTTIVGTTFRQKFADVYTSRQALLNAIYAAAKQKAQDAQDEADQAHASAVVQNSNFTKNLNGWSFEATPGPVGSTEFQRGTTAANSPYSPIPTHLIHNGVSVETSAYAVNDSYIAVQAGQQVVGSVALRSLSANSGARAQAYVRFYDKDGTYIGFLAGSPQLDPTAAPVLNSTVKGAAPSGAAFGRICILYTGHTSGVITATCAMLTATITDQDDLPDGSSYSRSMNGFHSETVDNATFSLPIDKKGNVPGWQGWQSPSLVGYAFDSTYSANVLAVTTSGANQGVETVRKYACKPGDFVSVTMDLYTDVGSTGAFFQIRFYKADGTLAAGINPKVQNSAFDVWETLTAADAARAGSAYFTIIIYTSTSSGRFLATNVRLSVNDVRVAGSRVKVGDQRNLPTVNFGNYGSAWAGLTFSYTATTTSATLTASAATLWAGGNSIAYNSASVSVTGTAGTTKTYYLYYDDPNTDGGTQILRATTSNVTATANDTRLRLGTATVTFPASGTSSGGGGNGPCPDENAWVLRADPEGLRPDWTVRAGEVEVGHYLRLTDGRAGLVTYSQRKAAPRVRVVARTGDSLTCSTSAPLELFGANGDCVPAPESAGHWVAARYDGYAHAAFIDRVEKEDDGWVQHITCENACFWTGDDPRYLFGHHNLKPG